MSEFYKALEQAERDRLRQDSATPTVAPVARSTEREKVVVPEAVATEAAPTATEKKPVVVEPPAPRPVPSEAPQARKAAEASPVRKAVADKVTTKPVADRSDGLARPLAKPASQLPTGTPDTVFRPALRTPERWRVLRRPSRRQAVLIAQTDPSSLEADAYRTLRANIELMSDDGAYRNIAITSATGGDGKSTTAANLAVVAAQAGRRVCLVDADLRRPILHDVFGMPNIDGLATALAKSIPLHSVARPADVENLSIVVAGCGAEEGIHDLITPERLANVLRGSEPVFDLVIFDSPPIKVADALGVAAVCDGVILVVRAGSIPFGVLRRAIGQINQVKGRVLGVLLNRADLRLSDADSYQYYGAAPGRRSPS